MLLDPDERAMVNSVEGVMQHPVEGIIVPNEDGWCC
jgi:hypothetical protein